MINLTPKISKLLLLVSICNLLIPQTVSALTCPDGEFESCLFGTCMCLPQIKGDIGRAVEETGKELIAQTAGPALQEWLVSSRNAAIHDATPIPDNIRKALSGYIDKETMDRARFKIGDDNLLSLANLSISFGDKIYGKQIAAVTMIDVIIFRNKKDAYNNPSLWAHELTHVKQCHDWGVHDFAMRYARDAGAVEKQAYAIGFGYENWKKKQNADKQLPRP